MNNKQNFVFFLFLDVKMFFILKLHLFIVLNVISLYVCFML